MNANTFVLLALLAISATFANPHLRLKRDDVIIAEEVPETDLGEDSPAVFEEGSGDEHHEHHVHEHDITEEPKEVEASGDVVHEEASTETAVLTSETAFVVQKAAEIVEAATVETVEEKSVETTSEEPVVVASTVINVVHEEPSTDAPSTTESPVSSASSFATSLFVLVAGYLLVL